MPPESSGEPPRRVGNHVPFRIRGSPRSGGPDGAWARVCHAVPVPILAAACTLAAVTWAYLLAGHGGYSATGQRLPPAAADPAAWPGVAAVVPARNEAAALPGTLPTLLGQDYPGAFRVVPSMTTARRRMAPPGSPARSATTTAGWPSCSGSPTPPGWAGKVWAMAQGRRAAGDARYILFTDADIGYAPGTVAALVRAAGADDRGLVSQMALLRAATFWERLLVPALFRVADGTIFVAVGIFHEDRADAVGTQAAPEATVALPQAFVVSADLGRSW